MAGELQSNLREELASEAGLAFKTAGVAAVVAAKPDGSTPRRYIKLLHGIFSTLQKHHEQLQPAVVKGLKQLDHAVTEAAHTHSAAASGKLHHFLTEDRQLRKLQATAGALHNELQGMAKLTTYVAAGILADVNDVLSKLSAAKCSLPSSQLQLIDQFTKLAAGVDPTCPEVPDGIQKSAEQVVRQVINEVHGPFFNDEILDKELTHLERAAQHLDPVQQRHDAALVKLLASTLMQLEADESEDDDEEESHIHMRLSDPFLIPAVPSVLRLVGRHEGQPPLLQQQQQQQQEQQRTLSSAQVLSIQLAGDGSTVNTPRGVDASDNVPGQQLFGSPTAPPIRPANSLAQPPSTTAEAVEQEAAASETANAIAGPSTISVADEGTPPSSLASQHLLEDFIEGKSGSRAHTREGRRACTFQAPLRLQPEGLTKLVQFLQQSPRVRGLSLAHNWIGADGAQRVCQAVMVHQSVRSLELQDNKLGDDGAAAVAQLLHAGARLVKLQLSNNGIGDQGALALATGIAGATALEKLSLYGNCIGSAGCQALTEAIKKNSSLKVVEYLPGNATTPLKDVKVLAKAVKQNRKFNIFNMFGKHS